jgi:hypothetical protein
MTDLARLLNIPGVSASHFRERTYPNAILLVASWDSVKADDNDPLHFTSAIGKTIASLNGSGLVDHKFQNVVVVVTKAKTFYSTDYDDYETEGEKDAEWQSDANGKVKIIQGLRQKVFPKSPFWPVVFVENGSSRGLKPQPRPYIKLPNGEWSHQNLFKAILNLVSPREALVKDFVGLHALRMLTGEGSMIEQLRTVPATEILIQQNAINGEFAAVRPYSQHDMPIVSDYLLP